MVAIIKEDQGWSYSGIATETISGGQLVKALSNTSTEVDLALVDAAGDGLLCVGLATNNAASGGRVGFMMRGVADFYAHTAVVAGNIVSAADGIATADAVIPHVTSLYTVQGSQALGRALTSCASAAMCRVAFNIC